MRTRPLAFLAIALTGALCLSSVPVAQAAPPERGTIQVASTSAADRTHSANGFSESPDITADGRFMVFASTATDLVAAPSSFGTRQIYLRDTATGSIRMISTNEDGSKAGDGYSFDPVISDDGTRVAFGTFAPNIKGAENFSAQAVVWNRETGTTTVASIDGLNIADRDVTDVDISGDGKVVAFSTAATNLASIPTYNKSQVYRRDLASAETRIVSVGDTGNAAADGAASPSVSRDGKAIAFVATGLEVDGDAPSNSQVYRALAGFSEPWIMSSRRGGTGGADAPSGEPSISADGESVVYSSSATDLDPAATRGNSQIYLRVASWSYSSIVSAPAHRGGASNGQCASPSFGATATRVAFVCTSNDLVPEANGTNQLYVGDPFHDALRLVSSSVTGVPSDRAIKTPALSGDGSLVAFSSDASNLVSGSSGMQVFLGAAVRKPVVERIGGADRYAASAAVSRATFPTGVPVAYIASGQGFADALPGSAMAGRQSGPVLLVTKDVVPAVISDELRRLQPGRIVILGGTNTVSDSVESSLASFAGKVVRVAGKDRYTGSALISATTAETDGAIHIGQKVFIATGENYPDALAASAAAGYVSAPVLLTQPDSITPEVLTEIRRLRTAFIEVVGGTNSVAPAVLDRLAEIAPVTRYDGLNRYETAAKVAVMFTEPERIVYIASGETYPDALSGSAAAVQSSSPVLLVSKATVPAATVAELQRLKPTRIVVVGGPNTVADSVLIDLKQYLAP
jgi:putative cell wall-binding protein/Tol biopolymer transport system component